MASAIPATADVFGGPVLEDARGGGSVVGGGSGSLDEALGGGSTAAGGVLCPATDQVMSSSSQVHLLTEPAVSGGDLVTPVARAAVRPQPTDGLRQPPASPVEPAVADRSGHGVVSAVGLPGSVCVSAGSPLVSPVRLAPPFCLRREDSVAGGSEGWLTVYPDALKKASDRVRARRLVKRLAMAKVKDGEFRAMLGCRRSGRLSSPATHAPAALGKGRSTDLKPIEEDSKSDGVRDTDGAVSVDLKLAHVDDDSDDSGVLMRASALVDGSDDSCPKPVPLLPFTGEAMDDAGAHGGDGDSVAAISTQLPCAVSGDSQVILSFTEEPMVEAVAPGGDGGSEADSYALLPGDESDESHVRLSCSQVESACLEDNPIGLADLVMESSVVLGGEHAQEEGEVADSSLSAGLGGDGSLESGQPGPVVEGVTLRLPSTDGRQQRPLMSAVSSYPVTGVEHDGHGGSEMFPVGCGEVNSLGDGDKVDLLFLHIPVIHFLFDRSWILFLSLSILHLDSVLWLDLLWFSPVRLAPPSCLRRGDTVAGGWEGWLTAYPDALKKASDRVRARRLVKRLAMAKAKDGEFLAKFRCRWSGLLSSPAIHAVAALGKGRSTELKPIEEDLESEGVRDTDGADSVDLKMAQFDEDNDDSGVLMRATSALGDGSDDSCPEPVPLLPFTEEAMAEAGAHGGDGVLVAAISAQLPGAVSGDS
ncbi:hypothetical protein Dimus_010814 [Dionaea muscipula]